MNRIFNGNTLLLLVVVIRVSFGLMGAIAEAQSFPTTDLTPKTVMVSQFGQNGDHDGDWILNSQDADLQPWRAQLGETGATETACLGLGRGGYGDGSNPQPRDGTGFGVQAHQNMGNCKLNKGQRNDEGRNRQRSCRQARDGSYLSKMGTVPSLPDTKKPSQKTKE